jgi:hypothetical protein
MENVSVRGKCEYVEKLWSVVSVSVGVKLSVECECEQCQCRIWGMPINMVTQER